MTAARATALGVLAGYVADALVGDPRRYHPVAAFGQAAAALERRMWADSRRRGALYAWICAGVPVAAGCAISGVTRDRPVLRAVAVASASWTVLGTRGLADEGSAMACLLEAGDVPSARARLAHLCGRDAAALDAAGLARAATESVAENTSDAVVAPLFWGAVAGIPGMLGYRALNTLDAMVGHRSDRYRRFGWAAARADDIANLVPARISAAIAVLAAPVAGGRVAPALRAWRRDAGKHPSPNAGQVEAAFAGALGVRLGGTSSYGGAAENRGELGSGCAPAPRDVRAAVRLSAVIGAVAALGLAWPAARHTAG